MINHFAKVEKFYLVLKLTVKLTVPGGGGNTTINAGTGCAFFWSAFLRAENKFRAVIIGKIARSQKFWGVILEK